MNQLDFETRLELYADDELHGSDAVALESELRGRPEARGHVAELRELRAAVRHSLDSVPLPIDLGVRLKRQLRAEREAGRVRLLAYTAAAAVLLLFALGPRWGGPVWVDPGLFAKTYRTCARDTSHNTLDHRPVIGEIVKVNGDYRVAIPDLRSLGFELEGVCTCNVGSDCYQFKAAHIHYKRTAHDATQPTVYLSVFPVDRPIALLGQTGSAEDSQARRQYEFARAGNVHVMEWRTGDRAVAMCAELSDDHMRGIAGDVQFAAHESIPFEALAALLILPER